MCFDVLLLASQNDSSRFFSYKAFGTAFKILYERSYRVIQDLRKLLQEMISQVFVIRKVPINMCPLLDSYGTNQLHYKLEYVASYQGFVVNSHGLVLRGFVITQSLTYRRRIEKTFYRHIQWERKHSFYNCKQRAIHGNFVADKLINQLTNYMACQIHEAKYFLKF